MARSFTITVHTEFGDKTYDIKARTPEKAIRIAKDYACEKASPVTCQEN